MQWVRNICLCGVAIAVTQETVASNRIDVPIVLGGEKSSNACGDAGEIIGLDPQGDGFLSVRSGPGDPQFREIDRLFNGNKVYICANNGPWLGAIYNDRHDLDSSCGVSNPWRTRQPYTGPCRYGWIYSKYVRIDEISNAEASPKDTSRQDVAHLPEAAPPPSKAPEPAETIKLERHGGAYLLQAQINDAVTVKFVLDSGAADVAIPRDVVLTLFRGGSLASADFIGAQTYILADGSKLPSARFLIHSLRVGSHIVRDVVASVAPVEADPLLGQSFLSKVPMWTFDNVHDVLILNDEPNSQPAMPSRPAPSQMAEVSPLQWIYSDLECNSYCGYPSAYMFVLRNKSQHDIKNIKYIVIFYGSNGTPIQSVEGTLGETILAGLAKTMTSDLGGNAPYPGHEIRNRTRNAEVRILDFEFAEASRESAR
jgi:predicted aspartyl protease